MGTFFIAGYHCGGRGLIPEAYCKPCNPLSSPPSKEFYAAINELDIWHDCCLLVGENLILYLILCSDPVMREEKLSSFIQHSLNTCSCA